MNQTLRKLSLTTHVVVSVGWLGAVAAYLALAIAGLTTREQEIARAAYISMAVIGKYVILPLGLLTLVAGLVHALGTSWGLFRYWWILIKFALTTGATAVLLMHLSAVTQMSSLAMNGSLSATDFRPLRVQLVLHAAGGLLVLLAATILSVYKPWGLTPYGRRKAQESPLRTRGTVTPRVRQTDATPRWVYVVGIHAVGLALLFAAWHVSSGGLRHH